MSKKIRIKKSNKDYEEGSNAAVENSNDPNQQTDELRIIRTVLVVCGLVFTLCLSIVVGGGLALWDLGKTPKDLFVSGSAKMAAQDSDNNLTFIDADDEQEAVENEDTSLTFIDANDVSEAEGDNEDVAAGRSVDIILDENADAVTKAEDGTIIVSSELSGVPSIKRAGQEEVLTVVSATAAITANPNEGFPRPFTAVDESYFNDALFIGDSRFYGFMLWSGIPGANYCATSFNIFQYETFKVVQTGNGKVPIFNALPYNAFTKIYIKVGLNEMGSSEERFEAKYAEIIARLREMEPRAIIYIHAVLPVTAAKSASDRTHNNPNIIARNASLKQFALEQKCYFIDAGGALSDDNGCLKAEMTGDGIHLSSRYMGVWKQYIMEHAVVVDGQSEEASEVETADEAAQAEANEQTEANEQNVDNQEQTVENSEQNANSV